MEPTLPKSNPISTIAVLGAGYVGLTTASLLAQAGYSVYVIEPNKERLSAIQAGKSFFYEAGIDPIIKKGVDEGTLIATSSYADSVARADIVFSCVGTPDNPDGSSNLSYVFSAAEEAVRHMQNHAIYVQKSTVPVGTGQKIIELFEEYGSSARYVSNPEFLREGTAVYDTLYFDRVVVGGDDADAVEAVLDVYRQLEEHRGSIAEIGDIKPGNRKGIYISTRLNSAELIKVTANAFLALKISFANSIAMLADRVGADIVEVMDAVGADERIGRAFLNAGRGYGGGCFPKDVSGLISSSLEYDVDMEIMQAAQAINSSMPGYIVEKIKTTLGGSVQNKKVAVLGLSFKPGTSDTRKSPGIAIANLLHEYHADVIGYDPKANDEARETLHPDILLASTATNALSGADAVVVATEWPDFTSLPHNNSSLIPLLVDAVNMFDPVEINNLGIQYVAVGRS